MASPCEHSNMNLQVPQQARYFLNSWATIYFSRTLVWAVNEWFVCDWKIFTTEKQLIWWKECNKWNACKNQSHIVNQNLLTQMSRCTVNLCYIERISNNVGLFKIHYLWHSGVFFWEQLVVWQLLSRVMVSAGYWYATSMQAAKPQTNHQFQWIYLATSEYEWLTLSSGHLCDNYK